MIALPSFIDREAWEGFEAMRKFIKKPMTDRARKLLLVRLQAIKDAGHCPNASLDQSTFHNWSNVYEPKNLEVSKTAHGDIERTKAYLESQSPREVTPERRAEIAAMLKEAGSRLRRVA